MSKQIHSDKDKLKNVNHDFLYHVEIQYETEHAFAYTSAIGNTIQELMKDVENRLSYVKDRSPKIVKALYKPQGESVNITSKINSLLKLRPYYSSK